MPEKNRDAENSPYNEQELEHFNQLLKEEHQQTKEKMDELQASLDDLEQHPEEESSAAAHHPGNVATEEDEREKYLIMLEKEHAKLKEINAALDRMDQGTYGRCQATGKKIQKGRLEAVPYARYSVEAQRESET
jgi:RNA polymerase-binding protein DksA